MLCLRAKIREKKEYFYRIIALFRDCGKLKSIPASMFDEAVKLKTLTSTFQGCASLEGESPYTVVDGVKYHLYDRTAENAATRQHTIYNMQRMRFKPRV